MTDILAGARPEEKAADR